MGYPKCNFEMVFDECIRGGWGLWTFACAIERCCTYNPATLSGGELYAAIRKTLTVSSLRPPNLGP